MRPRPQRLLDDREYPVLYVDDEPENLRIFELGFRREFSILTAPGGREGLEVLQSKPVAVVLPLLLPLLVALFVPLLSPVSEPHAPIAKPRSIELIKTVRTECL